MSDISPSGVPGDETFYRFIVEEKRRNARNAKDLTGKATLTQTWEQSWLIQYPDDGDYRVVVNSAVARNITDVTTVCTTGTATLTVKTNATALGGSANSVSTSEQSQSHTGSNSVSIGDDVVLTFSSTSGAENVSVKISGTLALAAS